MEMVITKKITKIIFYSIIKCKKKTTLCELLYNTHLTIFSNTLYNSCKSTRRPSSLNFSSKFIFLDTTLLRKKKLANVTKIRGYFWIVKHFWKYKKLCKVYNSHEYLCYESWVIWNNWSQNAKVTAKKQSNMKGVTQNSTSVSCNHSKIPHV